MYKKLHASVPPKLEFPTDDQSNLRIPFCFDSIEHLSNACQIIFSLFAKTNRSDLSKWLRVFIGPIDGVKSNFR